MGTVGQFSVIFPALAHNSNEIYCRCSITQNIAQKTRSLFPFPRSSIGLSLNHSGMHTRDIRRYSRGLPNDQFGSENNPND